MQTYIRVWERNRYTFIDMVNDANAVEFKQISWRRYPDKPVPYPSLSREVSWHVKRLVSVTGYKVVNETDLCL